MTCHLYVKPDSPNLALVRESWEKGEPLRWNRVVNLPDFVYFHHAPHVAKGWGAPSATAGWTRCPWSTSPRPSP